MGDTMREGFEAFHGRRKSKGAAYREALFARLPDDTYVDPSVQRHWWTWQNAAAAGRRLGMKQARREPLSEERLDVMCTEWLMTGDPNRPFTEGVRAAERAHGITPTQQAGDSDTPRHVCGTQGFGALGDVCPGCEKDKT